MQANDKQQMGQPKVADLFAGRSVFITGASGFIGRVLLEKLLRCYPDLVRVYILMRAKRNQSPSERLHKQLLKVPIFDRIRQLEQADPKLALLDKIQVIPGDIAEPGLGISSDDMQRLLDDETLSIVFHSAATIKFDEPLRVSVKLNLLATQTIIQFCKRISHRLVSFCHVSTAYVNSDIKDGSLIEERLYPIRETPQQLIQLAGLMDENQMQALKPLLVAARPNTYTYTKALAEHLIVQEAKELPVVIVRPSIVVAAWREPLPGWIDNLNGPTGLILAIGKGLLRTLHVNRAGKSDIIPVDVVVNTLIASAFYVAKKHARLQISARITNKPLAQIREFEQLVVAKENQDSVKLANSHATAATVEKPASSFKEVPMHNGDNSTDGQYPHDDNGNELRSFNRRQATEEQSNEQLNDHQSSIPIIHCNSGDLNPITWGRMESFLPIIRTYPSQQVLRYPFGSFKSNKYSDSLTRLYAHFIPALVIDLLCLLLGKKRQLLSVYFKLHSACAALTHFCTHNYNFRTKNLVLLRQQLSSEDQQELNMRIEELDWHDFWHSYCLGARRYVLKESDESLPEARRSFQRAFYIEMLVRASLLAILLVGLFLCLPTCQLSQLIWSTAV